MDKDAAAFAPTYYEKNLHWNSISTWMHSLRYLHTVDVFRDLQALHRLNVVDVGCAHAKLFETLNSRFLIDYTGIEILDDFVGVARHRYGHHNNFSVMHEDALAALERVSEPDVVLALETLEHIPEGQAVRLVEKIASLRPRKFICSVPVEVGPAVWLKNVGSLLCGYYRHQEYTWRETLAAGLYQLDSLPPHDIGHKGFDWRWLAQTIRQNMKITMLRRFPFKWLPASVSASVFIVAEPR